MKYLLVPKFSETVPSWSTANKIAVFLLGKVTSNYFVIKYDEDGSTLFDLANLKSTELKAIEEYIK